MLSFTKDRRPRIAKEREIDGRTSITNRNAMLSFTKDRRPRIARRERGIDGRSIIE